MSSQKMLMMMQAAPAGQPNGTLGALFGSFLFPMVLVFGVFYILVMRPQSKRLKEHQASIAAVKKGDEVITGGGIRGKVTKVTDDEAEVEISQGVKVRVVKSTITHVVTGSAKSAND
jgi:preprotein translocase subunit YajC